MQGATFDRDTNLLDANVNPDNFRHVDLSVIKSENLPPSLGTK
jgi:hypothetical protein